jgi:hypothetical protein
MGLIQRHQDWPAMQEPIHRQQYSVQALGEVALGVTTVEKTTENREEVA